MKLLLALTGALLFLPPAAARAADRKAYLEDYEFICDTVNQHGAAIRIKKTDWKAGSARLKADFSGCQNDADHVRNVMRLLALVQDSHTDVTRCSVEDLPSKFDGLYGGGLWFGWDAGKFVLRGVMPGHPLEGALTPGSVLLSVAGEPAWLAMERERRRIATWHGISSDHSLYSSLSNRLLPFGVAGEVDVEFLDPEGKVRKVKVARFGPGGKAFYPSEVQLPEGVTWAEGAVSTLMKTGWSDRVGYVRITGGMNQPTVAAFHAALEPLKEMTALLLDCRSMGGGGDDSAWEMAGRFFPKGADNGRNGRIEPSGAWQFDGPLVMLQNENMVSSAETFTWAMSETTRAVTVGRATGGWGIIPRGFQCPSGLVDFRLGVSDRPTPIQEVHTEGAGWPADITLPFGPVFCRESDPARAIGMQILEVLAAGFPADSVRADFVALFAGDIAKFRRAGERFEKKTRAFSADRLARQVLDDLKGELDLEVEMLRLDGAGTPDLLGLGRRLDRLLSRARAAGLTVQATRLQKTAKSKKAEAAAQEALLALLDAEFDVPGEREQQAYLRKHGKTDTGRVARDVLWK